jgi:hypothetical protein
MPQTVIAADIAGPKDIGRGTEAPMNNLMMRIFKEAKCLEDS